MAYQQKENDIAIFKVKEKKNENGPDYTGKALINGEEKDVSLWIKSDTMLAGTIKKKWEPSSQNGNKPVRQPEPMPIPIEELEDEIPF